MYVTVPPVQRYIQTEISPTFVSATKNDCSVRSVPFRVLVLILPMGDGTGDAVVVVGITVGPGMGEDICIRTLCSED